MPAGSRSSRALRRSRLEAGGLPSDAKTAHMGHSPPVGARRDAPTAAEASMGKLRVCMHALCAMRPNIRTSRTPLRISSAGQAARHLPHNTPRPHPISPACVAYWHSNDPNGVAVFPDHLLEHHFLIRHKHISFPINNQRQSRNTAIKRHRAISPSSSAGCTIETAICLRTRLRKKNPITRTVNPA
jgi:hypothetical protein